MHGLKLVIKDDTVPQEQMPHFPAVEKLAPKRLLAVETWNNKRAMINFKAIIEVPMLGTMIESCGDTLKESHMPLGWPMSIDGAVRQFCMHKRDTIQDLRVKVPHALWASQCDLRDPGWGDPGFRHC